ncbi:hypothetical protein MHU86_5981 [Fragilaria crotonensis]|nr:hypothetical protein MHU86_5981 [Fragilaria crotonensis]
MIPSHRPGRKTRSSPIDQFPSVSYGESVHHKTNGSLRLLFQNVKGLTHSSTLEDYRYYHQCLHGLSVDIMGLTETNTCLAHHHLSSDFRSATQRFHRQSKIIFGSASPEIDPCPLKESFQSGGNVMAVFGALSSRVAGPNIIDPTGLGRWSGVTLEGTQSRKLSIITAYRVCQGSPQSAPLGSSFLREYEFFRERTGTSVNPRRQFLSDLQQSVMRLQELGHLVILMLDANSTIEDRGFSEFVLSCGLNDLHSTDPAPSTYIGSHDRRIDFIFGCDDAKRLVIRSGTLAYTEGPQSENRSLYIDISPDFIATVSWSQIAPSTSRDLYTGNPELVAKYISAMLVYYKQHRMIERIEDLYQRHRQMSREEVRTELIKWDNDQGRSMEFSERLLRRPIRKYAWSPALRNSAILCSLSKESEDLLSGIIPSHWYGSDNYLREFLASFVIPSHVTIKGDIPTEISPDDVLRGFRGWKEQTSTSPSGRHLGHYRALIQDSVLLKCFVYFMNIAVARGIAIPRWCHATNVMIEKDAGKPCIHRLRIVHLFEADFNFFLKLQWGHRLVRHACALDLLHDSQHGSIPRRTAMDPIMLIQLTTDLCRILRHDMARFDNDASACYDRIIVALGMLAARRCGMPKNAVRLHADALQFMKYTVKTAYGVSESNYSGTPFAPLFGTGQGSGASPAVWLSFVVLLLHTFDRIVPHRMHFEPIDGGRSHSRSSDAFVDDTSVGFTSSDDNTSYDELIARLEFVAQSWEKLLSLSGGKLNLKKCTYFVLQWDWQHGRPIIRKMLPSDSSVSLTQGQSATRHAIKRTSPTESIRMLGVLLNPMGDFTDHLASLKAKADTFATRLRSPRLTETDIEIFHRSIYVPSMRYSLAALATDEEELSKVQSKISRVILQRLHIRSTISTALRYGPLELGGLAGVGFHLLEKPNHFIPYLTPSWILSVRQFLGNNKMHLQISDLHMDKLHGPTDAYIMQSEHLQRYTPLQQSDLNLVRMWLQVATLADMCDPNRPNCILLCFLDGHRPINFKSSPTWPRQAPPSKAQLRLWKRFIRSSYLRYTPYWKTPPISPISRPAVPTALPHSFPDIQSYIASLQSRTERRLLDGLQQLATDLQVWRAFRSKARLHLASDGGLSETSATHGWTLSTGKHVLFTCSGPVDGPFDTNSSTRSELGGCASALLFLSSLQHLWGLKHRCSFKWYSDSRSAISRFRKYCGRRRSIRMPSDADLLSIISSSLRVLRRPFRPVWIKAHQDDSIAYNALPLAARLNIDADFLATRYREHGRLRCRPMVDHRPDIGSTLFINGTPVTGQYDDNIRFHVNGYHQRAEIQKTERWDADVWELVDFYTFGKHFRRLRPSLRIQHFKFIHEVLPLGVQRLRESVIKDDSLQRCPCCKISEETHHHFLRCPSNPAFTTSLVALRSEILTSDTHPIRFLIADGIRHTLTSDLPFSPDIHQYPSHLQPLIVAALSSQQQIGWQSAVKGYLTRDWANLAQLDMHRPHKDVRNGESRMMQIIIGARLTNIKIPECDLLVSLHPAWSASTKHDIVTSFPRGVGMFSGIASAASG